MPDGVHAVPGGGRGEGYAVKATESFEVDNPAGIP